MISWFDGAVKSGGCAGGSCTHAAPSDLFSASCNAPNSFYVSFRLCCIICREKWSTMRNVKASLWFATLGIVFTFAVVSKANAGLTETKLDNAVSVASGATNKSFISIGNGIRATNITVFAEFTNSTSASDIVLQVVPYSSAGNTSKMGIAPCLGSNTAVVLNGETTTVSQSCNPGAQSYFGIWVEVKNAANAARTLTTFVTWFDDSSVTVSGTVTANAGTGTFSTRDASPATTPVSGTITANAGTGTFSTHDASPATTPVSGTVTANAGTGTFSTHDSSPATTPVSG